VFEGKRGHPLLIKERLLPEILHMPLTASLHELLERHPENTLEVPVSDSDVTVDIDTPEDYQRLRI
jgi:CTP:molybdopterin cytidylyltransferase MocA